MFLIELTLCLIIIIIFYLIFPFKNTTPISHIELIFKCLRSIPPISSRLNYKELIFKCLCSISPISSILNYKLSLKIFVISFFKL